MMTGVPWEIDDTVPEGVPWEIDDVTPRQQATPAVRNNGLLPSANEDQGALVRRRINALLQGVGGTANYFADLGTRAGNSLGITNIPEAQLPSNRFATFLEQVGLERPSTAEKVVGGLVGGRMDPGLPAVARSFIKAAPLYDAGRFDALGRPLQGNVAPTRNWNETPTRTAAREQGMASNYKFAPTEVPGTPMGNVGEYFGPSPELKAALSRDNLRTLNSNIAREITLPTGESVGSGGLTRPALRDLSSKAWNIGYAPIAALKQPTPLNAKDILEMNRIAANPDVAKRVSTILTNAGGQKDSGSMLASIRDLRKAADKAYKTDPDMATALKDYVGVLEGALQRNLGKVPGGPEAFDNYLAMRQKIAQISAVKKALGPGGNVDVTKLAAAASKDAPFTGELRTGADMGENFPTLFQIPRTGEALQTERTTGPVGNALYRAVTLLGYPSRKWIGSRGYQTRLQQANAWPLGDMGKGQSLFGAGIQATDEFRPFLDNLFQPE